MINKKIPDFAEFVSESPGTFLHSALYWQDIMDVDRVFCENYCELCEAYPGHKAHEAHCKGIAIYDARHEKIDLKVFVVVIPKEGRAHPSFGMTPTFQSLTLLTS